VLPFVGGSERCSRKSRHPRALPQHDRIARPADCESDSWRPMLVGVTEQWIALIAVLVAALGSAALLFWLYW
jgi:hypothetical protein